MKYTIVFLLILTTKMYSQIGGKPATEDYSQKFYKVGNEFYGLKVPYKPVPTGDLYKVILNKKLDCEKIFPPEKNILLYSFSDNFIWDININLYIYLEKTKRGPEIGNGTNNILFYEKKTFSKFKPDNWFVFNLRTASHSMNSISDINYKREWGSYKDYFQYDLILCQDETMLMPVAYKDSLYFYTFTDKAWTLPNYEGVEKNKANDKWTRTAQTIHPFKTSFRAFNIENNTYFLANSDTMLYKYENNQIVPIGKIKKNGDERPVFLIDKDDQKVGFMFVKSIEIIDEERRRFLHLTPENTLYKAIKRIIDEPNRK